MNTTWYAVRLLDDTEPMMMQERHCWVDQSVRPMQYVTLKGTNNPEQGWLVAQVYGSSEEKPGMKNQWKVGGLQ